MLKNLILSVLLYAVVTEASALPTNCISEPVPPYLGVQLRCRTKDTMELDRTFLSALPSHGDQTKRLTEGYSFRIVNQPNYLECARSIGDTGPNFQFYGYWYYHRQNDPVGLYWSDFDTVFQPGYPPYAARLGFVKNTNGPNGKPCFGEFTPIGEIKCDVRCGKSELLVGHTSGTTVQDNVKGMINHHCENELSVPLELYCSSKSEPSEGTNVIANSRVTCAGTCDTPAEVSTVRGDGVNCASCFAYARSICKPNKFTKFDFTPDNGSCKRVQ
jgi:hypothetical protein